MKLATIHLEGSTAAVRVDGDTVVEIPGFADVGELLRAVNWADIARTADGPRHTLANVELGRLVPAPAKVFCIGLNYTKHILEMGRDLPAYPTVFAKFAETLTEPFADIVAVADDPNLDWEGELVVVIGADAEGVSEAEAGQFIAGYTVANDISMRGYQNRTNEWLQGKMWQRSTPVGPVLVTPDEFDSATATITTKVNDRVVQDDVIADLLFTPSHLVAYLSAIIPLRAGDLILTGTPGGVGHARKPAQYLVAGDTVSVAIAGIGELRNNIVAPS